MVAIIIHQGGINKRNVISSLQHQCVCIYFHPCSLIVFNYFNMRRKRLLLFRSTAIDHSYIEFNSNVIHSSHNDYDGLSTTKGKTVKNPSSYTTRLTNGTIDCRSVFCWVPVTYCFWYVYNFDSYRENLSTLYSLTVHEAIADVPPQEFSAYVKELHRDADRGFSLQFAALQAHSPTSIPCHTSQLDKNMDKNRYQNILPCQ